MKGVIICLLGLILLTGCSDTTAKDGKTLEQNLTTYLEQREYIEDGEIVIFRIYDIGKSYEYYLVEYSDGQYMVRLPSSDQPLTESDITVTAWEAVAETPYERDEMQRAMRRRSSNYHYTPIIIP